MLSSTDLNRIPIKNLYYMLCYAWEYLAEKDFAHIAREDEKDIKHLLTSILLVKLRSLIKRGFFRDYTSFQEETATLRGRVLFQESLDTFSFKRAKMHCEFEEMNYDISHNQIIKSTLYTLMQSPDLDRNLKDEILQVFHHFAGVRIIQLHYSLFAKVTLHRNNLYYRFVLDICRFLYESLLLHEKSGDEKFADFERDPGAMAKLFENFVRNFFKHETRQYRVYRENIYWEAEGDDLFYLPMMQTDISLENSDRKIIIDTKYYQESLRQYRGSEKLISGNLYQLFSYLSNVKMDRGKQLLGILLYPKVGRELNLSYKLKGYPVQFCTVDLNSDWRSIHERLVKIVS